MLRNVRLQGTESLANFTFRRLRNHRRAGFSQRLICIGQACPSCGVQPLWPSRASASPQSDRDARLSNSKRTPLTHSTQSAHSFEGKITKVGDQFVLQEDSTQAAYKLDDQDKAKQFKGRDVKVMATLDASSNMLHVIDIIPVSTE